MTKTRRLSLHRLRRAGYTLVELAIVLAVAGLLFTGLWRLLSGGNLQLKDAATATQQQQLIASVKGFLLSPAGSGYLQGLGASATWQLKLPSSAADAAGTGANCTGDGNMTNYPSFCNYLPSGFWTGTTNPYGQTYQIYVLNGTGTPPTTYSFMIITTGGEVISDSSGGRISSQIGADGGFIYSNNVCGTPTQNACGAYGAWSQTLAAYGIAAPANGGYVASRTYYSPDQDANQPWLARTLVNNNTAYNTMSTALFLGGQTMYAGSSAALTTGGGVVDMQAGNINLQRGHIIDNDSDPNNTSIQITHQGGNPPTNSVNQLTTSSGCIQATDPTVDGSGNIIPGTTAAGNPCNFSLEVTGDAAVSNYLAAHKLYSFTFLYNGSDRRLKDNIKALSPSIDQIMQLKPVSYTLKSDGSKSMGFIAQDVEQIYPDLVTGQGDKMKLLNYQGLIAPLVASVQELKRENDQLKTEIEKLKKRP